MRHLASCLKSQSLKSVASVLALCLAQLFSSQSGSLAQLCSSRSLSRLVVQQLISLLLSCLAVDLALLLSCLAVNNNNNKISLLKGGAKYLWYQLGTTINKKEKKVQSDLKGKS